MYIVDVARIFRFLHFLELIFRFRSFFSPLPPPLSSAVRLVGIVLSPFDETMVLADESPFYLKTDDSVAVQVWGFRATDHVTLSADILAGRSALMSPDNFVDADLACDRLRSVRHAISNTAAKDRTVAMFEDERRATEALSVAISEEEDQLRKKVENLERARKALVDFPTRTAVSMRASNLGGAEVFSGIEKNVVPDVLTSSVIDIAHEYIADRCWEFNYRMAEVASDLITDFSTANETRSTTPKDTHAFLEIDVQGCWLVGGHKEADRMNMPARVRFATYVNDSCSGVVGVIFQCLEQDGAGWQPLEYVFSCECVRIDPSVVEIGHGDRLYSRVRFSDEATAERACELVASAKKICCANGDPRGENCRAETLRRYPEFAEIIGIIDAVLPTRATHWDFNFDTISYVLDVPVPGEARMLTEEDTFLSLLPTVQSSEYRDWHRIGEAGDGVVAGSRDAPSSHQREDDHGALEYRLFVVRRGDSQANGNGGR